MGLFDSLKAMKNAITGGAAKVQLSVGTFRPGAPLRVRVDAQPQANFKIQSVYIQVRGLESVAVPDIDISKDGRSHRETVRASHPTFEHKFTISGPESLTEGRTRTWEADLPIPTSLPPVFKGRYCTHSYSILAGLDATGNDPDSGWVELQFAG